MDPTILDGVAEHSDEARGRPAGGRLMVEGARSWLRRAIGHVPRVRLRRYLVYVTDGPAAMTPQAGPPVGVHWLDEQAIERYFAGSRLLDRFLGFRRSGCVGLMLSVDDAPASYAWMSTPTSPPPPHLPGSLVPDDAYWIFHCRTIERFRGRGLYKTSIRLFLERAVAEADGSRIWIDTDIHNVPSRRAILSAGFLPDGRMSVVRVRLSESRTLLRGRWLRGRAHPMSKR